jgi:hypothetical protein
MHDGANARLDNCDKLERPEMPAQSVAVAVGGPAPRQGCNRGRKCPGGFEFANTPSTAAPVSIGCSEAFTDAP